MTTTNELEVRCLGMRHRVSKSFPNPGRTQQSFKEECDINGIMARWAKTGALTNGNRLQPKYGDFTTVPEHQVAMNLVIEAQDSFDRLPAITRDYFHNDPERLMAFIQDPLNTDKAVELGLADPRQPTTNKPAAEAVPAPAEPPSASATPPGEAAQANPQGGNP